MKKLLVCLALGAASMAYANDSRLYSESDPAITERIKPVGTVEVKTEANTPAGTTAAAPAATPAAEAPKSGEAIYGKYCVVCHAAGVAGAPKAHDQEAWAPRAKVGVDALVESATKGKNAMPAKGTCTECTPAELKAAIEFMLKKAD